MADDGDGDVLRILIASDMHLGYAEKDPIRGEDSFNTFEEIFIKANEQQADMVLLAGDLFHDNKPSRRALQRCMEVLRDHCLGQREVHIEVVSDQTANFHDKYKSVNYEDSNYNVQLPVFSIHGNHDDPAGDGGLAALDLMSTANLVNYFGRANDIAAVRLYPILIQKGITKLALYGLGHIRDERLHRALERKEVSVARPSKDTDQWFNLLALHQNRHERGAGDGKKGYINESQLPSCMDIVVWGHEHKCEIGSGAGTEAVGNNFVVLQPGSTVATSLVEGEAEDKHVGLLEVRGDQWKFTALPLETVRPFILKDVVLQDYEQEYDFNDEPTLMAFLEEKVEAAILELRERHTTTALTKAAENRAKFPLVRLRVDYSGYSTCNPQRFGQRFVDKVANPSDILLFTRKARKKAEAAAAAEARDEGTYDGGEPDDARTQIQSFVGEFLQKGSKEQLRLLAEQELNTAVFEGYVEKENKSAISAAVDEKLRQVRELLNGERAKGFDDGLDRKAKETFIEDMLAKQPQRTAPAAGAASSSAAGGGAGGGASAPPASSALSDAQDDSDDDAPAPPPAGRGRGRGKAAAAPPKAPAGCGAPAGRGRGRARGRAASSGRAGGRQATLNMSGGGGADSDDDDGTLFDEPAKPAGPAAGKKRAAPKRKAAAAPPRYAGADDDDVSEDDDDASVAASSKRSFASKRRMK